MHVQRRVQSIGQCKTFLNSGNSRSDTETVQCRPIQSSANNITNVNNILWDSVSMHIAVSEVADS